MDYRLVAFPILYTLRVVRIRCYFSDNIARTVAVSIDQCAVCCSVQPTLNTLAAKRWFLCPIRIVDRHIITI